MTLKHTGLRALALADTQITGSKFFQALIPLRLIAKTHISKHVDYSFTGKITCHYFTTKNMTSASFTHQKKKKKKMEIRKLSLYPG